MLASAVPARGPELPADLEGDDGLAGAGRHREQHARLALQDRLDGAVDGDLLVVARRLAGSVVAGREQPVGGLSSEAARRLGSAAHSSSGVGKASSVALEAGEVVELDDLVAVGRVGELRPSISA